MTRDSVQASKGQARVCVMCQQRRDNWLQNNVWCEGNLYHCILFGITVLYPKLFIDTAVMMCIYKPLSCC